MQSEKRKAYDREYKRRMRQDPEWRVRKNIYDRERRKSNPVVREKKNAQQRKRWATDTSYRERKNEQRLQTTKQQQFDEAWRERFRLWQNDYFNRHKDDPEWRQRRDAHRAARYYGVDDPQLVEALALARAAKRKMRDPK